jgi:Tol biopolymer transport system component
MGADGTGARPLTREGTLGHFTPWTPDGRGILFRCFCDGKHVPMIARLDGTGPDPLPRIEGGSHMSLSPDGGSLMDVQGHKVLWVSPLEGGTPSKVFEFEDPRTRIDYPVWSPDGHFVLFDRFEPQGGDVWTMDGLE